MSANTRRRRAGGHEEEHENAERWLLSYADFITLLLALFIVLFAMSSINVKKFLEFKLGLTESFNPSAIVTQGGTGILSGAPSIVAGSGTTTQSGASTSTGQHANQAQLEKVAMQLSNLLAREGIRKDATISLGPDSVVVQILADKVFFESDSAALGTVGSEIVDAVAIVVRSKPNVIDVQGFTDDEPITGGPFTSNWELSGARASAVALRLNEVDGIPAPRLEATGFGDTHPVVSNATAAGRAQNRRIDVVILGVPQSTGS
jgi:chemotaxis protein MotB